jgi:uncharacterized RDD family membrane protein YckC
MQEQFYLETPEAIGVSFDLAGIGTRFLAAVIDVLAIVGIVVVVAAGAAVIAQFGIVGSTVATIILLGVFFLVVVWGYYVVYETLWSGQTPGKRALRIRVIKISGYPIGFIDALIRNLMRLVDFLPALYAIGMLTMFISRQSRRLGDYAAGTIVIKERAIDTGPPAIRLTASPVAPEPERGAIDPEEHDWNLLAISPHDLTVIREYLVRQSELPQEARQRIGNEIATQVANEIGARHPADPIRFLARVLYLLQSE